MAIKQTPEQISDRQAIIETLYTHSRGLDRADAQILKSAYWSDAEVDYGAFKGSAHQFADIIGPALSSMYEITQHNLGQTYIELDGHRAKTETYVNARHLLTGATEEFNFAGRYLDTLELRDNEWRILHRQVVMDWSLRKAVSDERNSEAFEALSKGCNDKLDPAYNFFSGE